MKNNSNRQAKNKPIRNLSKQELPPKSNDFPSFQLVSELTPSGDQPKAIQSLLDGLFKGERFQTLKGVTGSGKTYTIANVIKEYQKPTLVLAHNKTLVGQLYSELKQLFPHNAVEYFISYYDYYQPEAYIAASDTYIEKDSAINEEIERLRHRSTSSLLERNDVIVVASVSCIYGLGNPSNYAKMLLHLKKGQLLEREKLIDELVRLRYVRDEEFFSRGKFRVRGEQIDIFPVSFSQTYVRISFDFDEIDQIVEIDALNHKVKAYCDYLCIFPANHYATEDENLNNAILSIEDELSQRLTYFKQNKQDIEAYRLEQRTRYDISMIKETGFTKGIENYSRYLDGREAGEAPYTLLDYFPDDFLLIVDESHMTIPQIGGMHKGDFSRKSSLINYGFRLPSAYDNRPLNFSEFLLKTGKTIFVSATPGKFELENSTNFVEQIIRPTGLLDPTIEICPKEGQIDVLFSKVRAVVRENGRVIILTLTIEMAEQFTEFLQKEGFSVKYIHSKIPTQERLLILQELRKGVFDIIVGINLLREGIDLPEVSLIAIMDADIRGLYRNEKSLIQMIGRAARNAKGHVMMFADNITPDMLEAISETNRRRTIQTEYNEKNNITPRTINKEILAIPTTKIISDNSITEADMAADSLSSQSFEYNQQSKAEAIYKEMLRASAVMDYSLAAKLKKEWERILSEIELNT